MHPVGIVDEDHVFIFGASAPAAARAHRVDADRCRPRGRLERSKLDRCRVTYSQDKHSSLREQGQCLALDLTTIVAVPTRERRGLIHQRARRKLALVLYALGFVSEAAQERLASPQTQLGQIVPVRNFKQWRTSRNGENLGSLMVAAIELRISVPVFSSCAPALSNQHHPFGSAAN